MVEWVESAADAQLRFEAELEFVQCLANPHYLNSLGQRGLFKDPAFLGYIEYLQYWRQQEYAKFLTYPACLYFLELLQNPKFRDMVCREDYTEFVHKQMYLNWLHRRQRKAADGEQSRDSPRSSSEAPETKNEPV